MFVVFCVSDFDISFSYHCPILVKIQSYYCHQSSSNLRVSPNNIVWDELKKISFQNNLACIDKNAFTKTLLVISNDMNLSDKEKVNQMVNKFTSVLNCAILRHNSPLRKINNRNKKRRKNNHGMTMTVQYNISF